MFRFSSVGLVSYKTEDTLDLSTCTQALSDFQPVVLMEEMIKNMEHDENYYVNAEGIYNKIPNM
jgi:hypothetical protein